MREPGGRVVVRRAERNVWSKLGGEVVILDLASSAYLGLEEVGAAIWDLLERPIRVEEIEARLLEEYDVEPDRLREDVRGFLSELAGRGLVELDADDAP